VYVAQPLVDAPLRPAYSEQVNVAFQREIARGLSGAVTYVYKKTHDLFDTTCTAQLTNQPNCPAKWLSNQPGASFGETDVLQASYYAYMFTLDYRSGRLQAYFNYVLSKSRGTSNAGANLGGDDFDWWPDNFRNRYGYLNDDARNRFKLYGAYRIPWIETTLSFAYNYQSGTPYTVTITSSNNGFIYVEPRGTDRTAVLHNLDLQFAKPISLGGRVNVTPIFTIFNVFSQEQPTDYFTDAGAPATVRQPYLWNRPRSYQIGVRVDWY
jgi:hypothetical protein